MAARYLHDPTIKIPLADLIPDRLKTTHPNGKPDGAHPPGPPQAVADDDRHGQPKRLTKVSRQTSRAGIRILRPEEHSLSVGTTCITDIRSVDACVGQNMPGAMLCNDEPRAGANNRARLTQNECDKTGVLTRQVCKRLRLRSDVDISESDPPPLSLGHHLLRDNQDRTSIRRYILSVCRCNDELAQRIPRQNDGEVPQRGEVQRAGFHRVIRYPSSGARHGFCTVY
ncbi:MAG: hypothetical protein CM15mP125_0020 [Gammaproteobacteria bacterium]|nr:MAG: hypothetical protein CM15mP125_0020 [Gammaproteobacteria bacterium]